MVPSCVGGVCASLGSAMVGFLLCVVCSWVRVGVINAQIRGGEADVEDIAAAGEMERARLRGEAGALLHKIGNVFRGERLVDKGILHRFGHGFRGVDVTQSDD